MPIENGSLEHGPHGGQTDALGGRLYARRKTTWRQPANDDRGRNLCDRDDGSFRLARYAADWDRRIPVNVKVGNSVTFAVEKKTAYPTGRRRIPITGDQECAQEQKGGVGAREFVPDRDDRTTHPVV